MSDIYIVTPPVEIAYTVDTYFKGAHIWSFHLTSTIINHITYQTRKHQAPICFYTWPNLHIPLRQSRCVDPRGGYHSFRRKDNSQNRRFDAGRRDVLFILAGAVVSTPARRCHIDGDRRVNRHSSSIARHN